MGYFSGLLSHLRNTAKSDAALRGETQCLLYFDVIPVDTLSVVMQYLAAHPHCKRWFATVDAKDVITVLSSGGALSVAARNRFTTMKKNEFEKSRRFQLAKLGIAMAPHLEHLYFQRLLFWRMRYDQFHALRVLIVSTTVSHRGMERILATCGASLRELRFEDSFSKRMSRAIARYCVALEVLDFGCKRYRGTLEPVFITIGNTLRKLSGSLLENNFVHVSRYCSCLEKLNLSNLADVSVPSVVELLKSLQTLRVLTIKLFNYGAPSLTIDNIDAFISVCSSELSINAEMRLDHSNEFVDYLRVMGARLRALKLNCQLYALPDDVLPLLVNLEKLNLSHDAYILDEDYVPALESIFRASMPNLRKLIVNCFHDPKILSVIARSISTLRDFECDLVSRAIFQETEMVPIQGADFGAVLSANDQLRRMVVITELIVGEPFMEEEIIVQLVGLIQNLEFGLSLKEVEIVDQPKVFSVASRRKIRDACVPLRKKRMNLVFAGERFLPS